MDDPMYICHCLNFAFDFSVFMLPVSQFSLDVISMELMLVWIPRAVSPRPTDRPTDHLLSEFLLQLPHYQLCALISDKPTSKGVLLGQKGEVSKVKKKLAKQTNKHPLEHTHTHTHACAITLASS